MLLNDLKKAALCVAAGFAVTMFGGCPVFSPLYRAKPR